MVKFWTILTICNLEDQDSSLSWLSLSNVNKCSTHNIKDVFGINTLPQGARGQTDSLLPLTELVAMEDCVCEWERE